MTTMSVVDAAVVAPRRRPIPGYRVAPNPGYRVAPPITDAYTPWVSALAEQLAAGEYRWIPDADGALVPVPVADEDGAPARPKRRLWSRRTQ
jgi:hypothetical protein